MPSLKITPLSAMAEDRTTGRLGGLVLLGQSADRA